MRNLFARKPLYSHQLSGKKRPHKHNALLLGSLARRIHYVLTLLKELFHLKGGHMKKQRGVATWTAVGNATVGMLHHALLRSKESLNLVNSIRLYHVAQVEKFWKFVQYQILLYVQNNIRHCLIHTQNIEQKTKSDT